jgi:hypothetical protein
MVVTTWRTNLKIHGITLSAGSDAKNLVVTSGANFPSSPDLGELFYMTGAQPGLYVYTGTQWIQVDNQPELPEPGTTGIVVKTGTGTSIARSVDGVAGEIDVVNGSGVSGNPTVGISDNPTIPGTANMVLPTGNTAQRGTARAGGIRYNSELQTVEAYTGGGWTTLLDENTILNGAVDPTTEGASGDFYINTTSWEIFGPKAAGVWGTGTDLIGPQGNVGATGPAGATGAAGAAGADGRTVLNGSVDPTTEGVNGDFYINTTSWQIFGPKTGGVWGTGTDLIGATGATGATGSTGAAGADGKTILNGTVAPTTEGVDGDFYINTATWEIYGPKTGGNWGSATDLIAAVNLNDLGDVTITAPSTGQVLKYNGSAWVNDAANAGTPGGADTQVQFNNGGAFGADDDFTWNSGTRTLALGTAGGLASVSIPNNLTFNGDTLYIDSTNSRVGFGTSTPEATLHVRSQGTTNTRGIVLQHVDDTTAFSHAKFIGRRSRGSNSTPTAVTADDSLAGFLAQGYKATGWSNTVGGLYIYAAENWTDTATGTYVTIRGPAPGGTTVSERARFEHGKTTIAGGLVTAASTTSLASLNLPHGTAPTSPVNGDIWTTTTGVFARVNGSTVDLAASGSTPAGSALQVQYNSGSGTLAASSDFTFSSVTTTLTVGTFEIKPNLMLIKPAASNAAVTYFIRGGESTDANEDGGDLSIFGGTPGAAAEGGKVTITGGSNGSDCLGGDVLVAGGAGAGTNRFGGSVTLLAGAGTGSAQGANVYLRAGSSATGTNGQVQLCTGGVAGPVGLAVEHVASAVNYLVVKGSSGTTPSIEARGTGDNVDITLTPKGTGRVVASAILVTPQSSTAAASVNVPHGSAPTSPVNGDIWTTTAGLFVRVNGVTRGPYLDMTAFTEYDAGNSGTAITINWTNGINQKVTLTGNATITLSTPTYPGRYQLRLIQNGANAYTVTWAGTPYSASRWLGAADAPAVNTSNTGETLITFSFDGTNFTQTLAKIGEA